MALKARGGMWHFVKMIGGRLHRRSTGHHVGSKKSRQAALVRAAEIELEIRNGAGTTDVPTVQEYWTETYQPTYTIRKRAGRLDHQIMAHALPFFGKMRLDEVKKSDCERYLNGRRAATPANPGRKFTTQPIAEGTVQRERSFLQAFFQQAVDDTVLERNPWRTVARVAYEVRDRLITEAEQAALLARLTPRFQRFLIFLLGTGVRLEECRGIDPQRDLHWEDRYVTVTGKFSKTRDVPLPVDLVPVLQAQLATDGQLWRQNPQRLREVLARACRARAGRPAIPHISPHACRHTYGWRYLKGGGDIYALSRILGHASVAVTEKHYARLLREDIRAKADRVDLGLPKTRTPATKVLGWQQGRKVGTPTL